MKVILQHHHCLQMEIERDLRSETWPAHCKMAVNCFHTLNLKVLTFFKSSCIDFKSTSDASRRAATPSSRDTTASSAADMSIVEADRTVLKVRSVM